MDEPFAALDEQTRLLLGDKVLQIQQQLKQTTLLITHNITEAVQLSDRILVMTYRPGRVKRIVEIDLPRPRTSEIVGSEAFGRYVAADLERPARGSDPRHARRARARARGGSAVTMAAARESLCGRCAALVGFGVGRSRFVVVVELLIRVGLLNRFIVPLPSEIIASFQRIVVEEDILGRFCSPARNASAPTLLVTVVGIAIGIAAAPLHICCGRPPRPGSRRWPRRRSC